MFTWVCPSCGKEQDLATKECPNCVGKAPEAAPPSQAASNLRFWLVLAAGTAAAIIALVLWIRYLSHRPAPAPPSKAAVAQPGSPQRLPAPEPVPETAPASPGPIEVAGIRTFYDAQNKPQVRVVIINHGEDGLRNTTLTVTLRPARSPADSPPLARFSVKISSEIKPGDSQEIKAPLDAFATLAAMPPWHQIRADVQW